MDTMSLMPETELPPATMPSAFRQSVLPLYFDTNTMSVWSYMAFWMQGSVDRMDPSSFQPTTQPSEFIEGDGTAAILTVSVQSDVSQYLRPS